ncbi:MAG: hypothetical protein IT328_14330 [Caldilineaceae bacterium]|nr:hypothetical protein [Caldilineaceae bacterium]
MSRTSHTVARTLSLLALMMLLLAVEAPAALAQSGPTVTIKPVVAPRRSPAPIPHTSVIPGGTLQAGDVGPLSTAANAAATAQGSVGKPGVLQTETGVGSGITLYHPDDVCNDFNAAARWDGETWTNYFAGWGTYAADGGIYQAKNVTFDRERVVGPGNRYSNSQSSMKIASNQPYEAGIMSPPITVRRGDVVRVRAAYLIYNHDTPGRNWDYVSMGIIPNIGETASYVQGYQRGEWAILEHEIEATGSRVVIMLQGHSPDAINSNVYFDNVQIYVNDRPRGNCRG